MNGCGRYKKAFFTITGADRIWPSLENLALVYNISQNCLWQKKIILRKEPIPGALYPLQKELEEGEWRLMWPSARAYAEVGLLSPDLLAPPGPWIGLSLHPSFLKAHEFSSWCHSPAAYSLGDFLPGP